MNTAIGWRARSEWRGNRAALILLALLVTIGGGAAIASVAAARRTDTAFERLSTATHYPTMFVSGLTDDAVIDLDPARLDALAAVPGVVNVRAEAFMGVAPVGYPNFFNLAVFDQRGDNGRIVVVDGSTPKDPFDLAADEVYLNEAMSAAIAKGAGDTFEIDSYTPAQWERATLQEDPGPPAGPHLTLRVKAVARDVDGLADSPDPFLLLPPAFWVAHRADIGHCDCIVDVYTGTAPLAPVLEDVAALYPEATVEPAAPVDDRIGDTIALQRRAFLVIAVVAALATGIVVLHSARRIARALDAEDDIYRALGMTTAQGRAVRSITIAPAVVAGTLGAVALAYALSPLAPVGLTRRAEPDPGLRADPLALGLGAIGLLLAITALVVAAGAVRPGDPLRKRSRTSARGGAARGGIGNVPFRMGQRLATGPGRGIAIGALLVSAGLVGAATLERSIDHLAKTPSLFGADFDAVATAESRTALDALATRFRADEDIEAVAGFWNERSGLDETPVVVHGPAGTTTVAPIAIQPIVGSIEAIVADGHAPTGANEVVAGRAVLRALGVGIGDRVQADGLAGPVDLDVVGVLVSSDEDTADTGFGLTLDGLGAVVEAGPAGVLVRFAAGADRAAITERYADARLTAAVPPADVGNLGQLGGLPLRVGLLFAALGLGVIVHALVVTVRRGRRPLAIHRALGLTPGQGIGAHAWLGALAGIAGIAAGASLGFVVARRLHRELVTGVGAIPQIVLPEHLWLLLAAIAAAALAISLMAGAIAVRPRLSLLLRVE